MKEETEPFVGRVLWTYGEWGTKMEQQKARKLYQWLWLSPMATVPTLCAVFLKYSDRAEQMSVLVAIVASSLWHLVLLIPAFGKEHAFIRWHGRQALVLAAIRTAVPVFFVLSSGYFLDLLKAVPVLIIVWFVGTLWGQRQAARGDCSLMRWFGQGALLPALQGANEAVQVPEPSTNALLDIIRYSSEPEERRDALSELKRREMVEPL